MPSLAGNLTFNSEEVDNVETGSGVETVELDGSGGGEPEVDPDSDYAMGEPSNWLGKTLLTKLTYLNQLDSFLLQLI